MRPQGRVAVDAIMAAVEKTPKTKRASLRMKIAAQVGWVEAEAYNLGVRHERERIRQTLRELVGLDNTAETPDQN